VASCDALLRSIRLANRTSYGEQGKRVHIVPEVGEAIAFYQTDHNEFRREFGLEGASVSDVAVDVHRPQASSRSVFFIELKGRHIDKALDQLKSTILAVQGCVKREAPCASLHAVIVSSGGIAPKMLAGPIARFPSVTRIAPTVRRTKNLDLRELIGKSAQLHCERSVEKIAKAPRRQGS
jgi:hypothetical protein